MKTILLYVLLVGSVGVNVYLGGKEYLDSAYIPDEEERAILSEMVQKTVKSEDYKKIAQREDIVAIESHMDRFKGGFFLIILE